MRAQQSEAERTPLPVWQEYRRGGAGDKMVQNREKLATILANEREKDKLQNKVRITGARSGLSAASTLPASSALG